jgi:tetratricopeptide (TPR) repeat protein
VELDPGFALAWAELSKANTRLYFILADPSGARLSAAKEAVETAVRLAPELPEAHLAFGYYYYHGSRDYDRALWEFAIAREGQPSNAELEEASAFVQRRQGRFNEALAILKRAAELDPRSAPGRWRWDSCFSSCDATRRPSDTAIARARSPPKSPTPTGGSFCSTWIRAPTRSRRRRPLPLSKDALSYTPWWLAIVLARAGDDQAALDELETLLSVPYYFSASFLTMDPRMDPLRDNPRFQKLIGEAAR